MNFQCTKSYQKSESELNLEFTDFQGDWSINKNHNFCLDLILFWIEKNLVI